MLKEFDYAPINPEQTRIVQTFTKDMHRELLGRVLHTIEIMGLTETHEDRVKDRIRMDTNELFSNFNASLKERGFFQELTHEECGTHIYPGLGFKISRVPNSIRRPPVRLGEHNEYVYKELLGVSEEEYRQLEEEGHIGMDFLPEVR